MYRSILFRYGTLQLSTLSVQYLTFIFQTSYYMQNIQDVQHLTDKPIGGAVWWLITHHRRVFMSHTQWMRLMTIIILRLQNNVVECWFYSLHHLVSYFSGV